MARQRLVVVGGVAAGMSAASRARRLDPDLEIVVFEATGYVSYGSCGLPYFIAGVVTEADDLIAITAERFRKERDIQVHTGHRVTGIDPAAGQLSVVELANGHERRVGFDRLVLATGGRPARPPIPGLDLPGVFGVRTVEDGLAIRGYLEERRPRRAVILGAGYIGLEMAEALVARGLEVTVLDLARQVLTTVDPDVAGRVQAELERHGVRVVLESPVEAVLGGDGAHGRAGSGGHGSTAGVRAVRAGGQSFPADLVLLGLGVRPQAELAEEAGLKLGASGAVAVTGRLETSQPGIYAAGDVAEVRHLVTGRPAYVPLGTTANKQGRVAGENAAGGDARFPGVVGTAVVKVFGLEVARTGLSEAQAKAEGFDAAGHAITHGVRAHYYPGPGPATVKLVAERGTGRLLGAQMVGEAGVAKRIDVVATALHAGWTVDRLAELDLSYAPPYSPVYDPILIAASETAKRL